MTYNFDLVQASHLVFIIHSHCKLFDGPVIYFQD